MTTLLSRLGCAFFERMGLNAYVTGDYAAAELWFRRMARIEPDSLRLLRNLGAVLLAKGDVVEGGRLLRREEELYGPSFHRHFALAELAYAQGRREEASRRYAKALAEPEAREGGSASGSRALMEARLAICADAAAWARSRLAPERFAAAESAAAAAAAAKPPAGEAGLATALAAYAEAVELDPTLWSALNNSGTILLNLRGEPSRALELFERAYALSRSATLARNIELAREAIAKAAKKAAR